MGAKCFEALGLTEGASEEEVKSVWRQLASQNHPDRGGDAGEFSRLRKAYNEALAIATEPKECSTCRGSGKVQVVSGWSSVSVACSDCDGTGKLGP